MPSETSQRATTSNVSPVTPGPSSTTSTSARCAPIARASAAVTESARAPLGPRGRSVTRARAPIAAATTAERLVPMLRMPMTKASRACRSPTSQA